MPYSFPSPGREGLKPAPDPGSSAGQALIRGVSEIDRFPAVGMAGCFTPGYGK